MLGMVWDTSPALVSATAVLRLFRALLPVAMLWVSKLILDSVVGWIRRGNGDSRRIWKLVALELSLAVMSDLLGRANSLFDSLLGDRFTNRISVRLIEHATKLDLASFEDPVFYDKLERAERIKVRALDRDGVSFELEAEGMLAVCIQHEMDHLDGKLFVDYLSELKRQLIRRRLQKERKQRSPAEARVPVPVL